MAGGKSLVTPREHLNSLTDTCECRGDPKYVWLCVWLTFLGRNI
jgi:hypothetical protein